MSSLFKDLPLVIHHLTIDPTPVPPGSEFDAIIEYTITESSGHRSKIPVSFWYEIYSGDKKLYEKGPIEIMGTNGKGMKRIQPVQASKRTGSYRFKVRLVYQKVTQTRTVPFRIGD
jgi:hypothetical protein